MSKIRRIDSNKNTPMQYTEIKDIGLELMRYVVLQAKIDGVQYFKNLQLKPEEQRTMWEYSIKNLYHELETMLGGYFAKTIIDWCEERANTLIKENLK